MHIKELLFGFVVLLLSSSYASDELVSVPAGSLRAIWLTPVVSKRVQQRPMKIRVRSFLMMKYAVTRAQFAEFLIKNSNWKKELVSSIFADATYLDGWSEDKNLLQSPVTGVSWFAAKAFCESRGLRLPTLNEWEYAAAASETQKDANKEPKFLKRILEWYGEPKQNQIRNVGSIYKNKYGLWDMHGLIWEWVEDFNSTFVTGESRQDGSLNKDMFCGAGAMSSGDKENYAAYMRFAFRSSLKGTSTVWNLGFRCVRSL